MKYLLYLVEAILAVNLLVIVHELGHLIAGKLFRVQSLSSPSVLARGWRDSDSGARIIVSPLFP